MNNIAFFAISTELGGAEKSLLDFLKEFSKQHQALMVFVPKNTGPLLDELDQLNISYRVLALPSFFLSISRKRFLKTFLLIFPAILYSLYYLLKLQKQLSSHHIKVIHSTGIKFHILLLCLTLFNSERHFHLHIRDIISSPILKNFFYLFKKKKNVHFIFNSKATANALSALPSLIIYNGFDSQLLRPGHSSLKSDLKLTEDKVLIAIVGVIARWKGQREFLKMAKEVSQSYPDAHFLIVGDEIYDTSAEKGELSDLKDLSKKLGLQNKVHFLSFQKDIGKVYRGIDILVHGSITPEPFGRVIVEAMLCGCPVIASNKGGPLEIITNNLNGVLYEQANIKALSLAVSALLGDKQRQESIAFEARKRAQEFSLQNYSQSLASQLLKS